ncbi:MAG: hypothetical protein PVSMB7_11410 [Chloroflexota bacterium]
MADGVVEASWIVAALALPLYFSSVTTTGFEPDKAVLVRVFAVIAGAAWLVGEVVRDRQGSRTVNPVVVVGLAVIAAFALATLLSIDRRLSLYGSQSRGEGLLTYLAYGTFFLTIATRLRRRVQFERLITVIVFGSAPAVIYGFIQQFGLDPLPTQGDPSVLVWPSRSTFGQHVFLGSYLVLVTPLTLARVLQCWSRRDEDPVKGMGDEVILGGLATAFVSASFFLFLYVGFHRSQVFALLPLVLAGYAALGLFFEHLPETLGVRRLRLWGYTFLLLLQVITLGVTGARGAWLGFFASVPIFAFLLAWWLRRPRIWWSVLGASVAVALFVFVLNIPGGPLQRLRTVHGLNRVANLTESGEAVSSTKGRMEIWQAVGTLMTKDPAIGGEWGGPGRDLVGYGPDTMHLDFESIFPLKLRRTTFEVWTWDRSHNIYLDYFVQAGILGVLALLAVVGLFIRRVLLALRTADQKTAWGIMGLGAAVGGHAADGLFGIEMPAGLLLFWLFIGVGAALPVLVGTGQEEEPVKRMQAVRPVLTIWGCLIALFILVTLVPPLADHPTLMAAIWLLAGMLGVGIVAHLLLDRVFRSGGQRGVGHAARRGHAVAMGAILVGAALALGSQFQFENAAMNELIGIRMLGSLQTQQAVADFQKTIRARSIEPLYYHDLGSAYLNLALLKYQSADPTYHPTSGDAVSLPSETAITLGRDQLFQLSVYAFEKASALDPYDPQYLDSVGDTYLRWNHPQQALAAFQRAESLSYQNPKYLAEESRALLRMNRGPEALAVARQAVSLDPSYWYGHASAALVYHQLGQKAQAKSEAYLALFWEPVFWPPPPQA